MKEAIDALVEAIISLDQSESITEVQAALIAHDLICTIADAALEHRPSKQTIHVSEEIAKMSSQYKKARKVSST